MVDIDYFHFTLSKMEMTCATKTHCNWIQTLLELIIVEFHIFNVTKVWDVLPDKSVSCPSLH